MPSPAQLTVQIPNRVVAKTAAYTVSVDDNEQLHTQSGSYTVTLPDAMSAGLGFSIAFRNIGTGIVTIDGNAAETIDGRPSIELTPEGVVQLVGDEVEWHSTFAKGLDVFDVRRFGAVGDGAADDTTAIQATIDAASSSGGAVFFPPADYLVSAALSVASNTRLFGLGYQSRVIAKAGGFGGKSVLFDVDGKSQVEITGLFVDLTLVTSVVYGVRVQNSNRVDIYRCWFSSDFAGAYPVLLRNSSDRVRVNFNWIQTSTIGILVKPAIGGGAGTATDFQANGNEIWGGGTIGISLDNDVVRAQCAHNIIRDMTNTVGAQGFSLSVAHGTDIELVSNILLNSGNEHIHVEGTSGRLLIRGGILDGAGSRGIRIIHASTFVTEEIIIDAVDILNSTSEGLEVAGNGSLNDVVVSKLLVKGSGSNGVIVNGAGNRRVHFIGNISKNNTGVGLTYNGSADAVFSNNISTDDQGTKTQTYGIQLRSSASNVVIDSTNHLSGNLTGPVNNINQASGDKRSKTKELIANSAADSLVFRAERDGLITEARIIYENAPTGTVGAGVDIGIQGNATKYASITTATSGSQWDATAITLSANDFAAGDRIVVSNDGGGDAAVDFIIEIEYFEYN